MTTRENLEIEASLLGLDLDYEPEVAIEDIEAISETEWLQSRQKGFGGSEAGALMGGNINKYTTPAAITLSKLTPITAPEKKSPEQQYTLDFGHALEKPLLDLYERLSGNKVKVFTDRRQFRHPLYPWMLADVDGFAYTETGEVIGLECKTFNYEFKKNWRSGVAGKDAIFPESYHYQMIHYASVLNVSKFQCIGIPGNSASDLVIITYNRDLKLEKELIEVEKKAWEDLQNGIVPEFHTLNKYQYNNLLNVVTTDEPKVKESINLPAELVENINEILLLEDEKSAIKKRIDSLDERINALRIPIISALGDHEVGVYADEVNSYQVTYKGSVRKGLDQKRLEINEPEIYEKYRKDVKVSPSLKIVQKRKM